MIPDPFLRESCAADALVEGYYLDQQIEIAGVPFDEPLKVGGIRYEELNDVWPRVARTPIDETEYRYRVERAAWSAENDPDDAMATPGGRIDPMTATLPGL
jgi:hypothetical protein